MYSSSFIFIALASVFAADVHARSFFSRIVARGSVTQLSDGTSMQYGDSNLAPGLKQWQSTGILTQGCSDSAAKITDCYGITLTSNPNQHLGESPRQRVEFRTIAQKEGSSVHYTWKQLLHPVDTVTDLFHVSQVIDESYGGPVFTLDAIDNKCQFVDYAPERQNCGGSCPSVPLSQCTGKTLLHSANITFGQQGSAVYTVSDATSGKQILSYEPKGWTGGNSSYVKYGVYRSTDPGQSEVSMSVGDFAFEQL